MAARAGPPTFTSKAATSIAAGSSPRSGRGVIAFGGAPYKAVLTHGFIVDEERKKISKSNTYEKPQTSDSYIAEYGADVMRLWISSQNFRDDIPISKEILSHVGETYRLLRNTFRFQLSNLFDFDPAHDAVPVEQHGHARPLGVAPDGRIAPRSARRPTRPTNSTGSTSSATSSAAVTLSATYHDILKDRLYTLGADQSAAPLVADRPAPHPAHARPRARADHHLHRGRSLVVRHGRSRIRRRVRSTCRTGRPRPPNGPMPGWPRNSNT